MKDNIIVIGAGHGGLVAAAKLAEKGFKVHIYEKNNKENLSWDWRDNVDLEVFKRVGIPEPNPSNYLRPASSRFLSPDEKTRFITDVPVEKRDITIERRYLINILIENALKFGVEISYETEVISPIIVEGVVKGIKTKNEEIMADLIIDSSGVNTPIKSQLPDSYNMNQTLKRGELFNTYRAYYNKVDTKLENQDYWEVCLGYLKKRGISWVNTANEYGDILIGCIDPFRKGEIKDLVEDLRSKHPGIGENLLRGGQVVPIPLRRTAPMIVGPNYVLLGDAAWMAVPITGSGVLTAMIAGDILAKTIINASEKPVDNNISYKVKDLWLYQYQYIQEFGADNVFIDILKDYLLTASFEDMNYAFKKRLLMGEDIEAGRTGEDVNLSFFNVLGRLIRSFPRPGVIINLGMQIRKGKEAKKETLKIPKEYNEQLVQQWIKKVDSYFESFYEKFEAQRPD